MSKPTITKIPLKNITILGKYSYKLYLVDADGSQWYEAKPISKGIVRTAETVEILKIILENDALTLQQKEAKQRTR